MSHNNIGRPLKFKTPEELAKKIDEYFVMCDAQEKPYTITGLALALDTSRQTLVNYEDKDMFFDTIKRAKDRCENFIEEGMLTNKLNTTACIFNAKNNYGWKDKTEQEHKVEMVTPLLGGSSVSENPSNREDTQT
jgi:hypothetical protein